MAEKIITSIDLNCDMGELLPGQTENYDAEIMPYISSCNVCCGFHSGNPVVIENTIRAAVENKVSIGAHPSYDDRENFGRKSMDIPLSLLIPQLRYQIYAVKGITESFGVQLQHVKPHGALYNDMVKDVELAESVVSLIQSIDPQLKIFALANSHIHDICAHKGMQSVHEVFADRRYDALTQLRSRQKEDAVIYNSEEVLSQVNGFMKGNLNINNAFSDTKAESICLHSDTKDAVQLCKDIFQHLKSNNVEISAPQ